MAAMRGGEFPVLACTENADFAFWVKWRCCVSQRRRTFSPDASMRRPSLPAPNFSYKRMEIIVYDLVL